MKFTVKSDYLEKALDMATTIVPRKSPLLSLEGVKIETQNSKLKILTTDLENEYVATIDAEVLKEGQTVIPLKNLKQLVDKIDYPEIDIELKDNILVINAFNFTAELSTIDTSEYPDMSLISNEFYNLTEMESHFLDQAINSVAYSSSYPDESNPVFSGILFEVQKDGINFVATDGSQLAFKKIPQQTKVKKETNLIVPLKILRTIQKNSEGIITIQTDNLENPKIISFKQRTSIGEIQLASKLIEGNFPKYREVIPQDFEINIVLSRKILLDAIKRILVVSKSRELSGIVIFEIKQNKMIVKSIESEIGKAKEEIILKKEVQKDLTIYFNGKFVETMLSNIKEEEIELNFIDETSPMKVSVSDNQDFLYLLMPIRITATV